MMDNLDRWLKQTVAGGKKISSNQFYQQKKIHKDFSHQPHGKDQQKNLSALKIVFLGGVEEVGKNMTAIEYGDDIIIIDMGLQFPDEDMLGVDYVIPDISYLNDKIKKVRGIFITHGHLDHIGAIPYLFPKFGSIPFYGTKLTMGLAQNRLEEFGYAKMANLKIINPDETIKLGCFTINFFRVNHSIPDGVGIIIDTPHGKIVHTGDFKFDFTPADNVLTDFSKLAELGSKNVIALLSDSTNATKPGHTISEKEIGKTLDDIIKNTQGRLIIASFASLISRIQQIINSAEKYNKTVFVSGRSMVDNISLATKLGYLKFQSGHLKDINKYVHNRDKNRAIILSTGSQGEAVSSLTRMAMNDHSQIKIQKGDTIVISSSPIVGNERDIINTIDNLCSLGATVITNNIMDVHVSGHGQQEDLKLMISLVKPKYLIPIHGLLYMRKAHGKIGEDLGLKEENIIYVENGSILEVKENKIKQMENKAESKYVIVDGLGVGNTGAAVLRERQEMSQNGIVVVLFKAEKDTKKLIKKPKIISKGFLYLTETELIEAEIIQKSTEAYNRLIEKDPKASWNDFSNYISGTIQRYVHKKLDRQPLILPIIIEV